MTTMAKVVPIRPVTALFNPELRGRLNEALKPVHNKPEDIVTIIEAEICAHLVDMVRRRASTFASYLMEKLFNGKK
jgi:hypothetical protein